MSVRVPLVALLAYCCVGIQLRAQRVALATHDWNGLNVLEPDTWADVVTPGDGRTYSVGTTIALNPTIAPTRFSTQDVQYLPAAVGPWGNAATRQVVIVQVAEPGQNAGIKKQAYFHGIGGAMGGAIGPSAYARAIDVWPAPNPADARIVICGATRDPSLPGSAPTNTAAFSTSPPFSGFIAVLDGDLSFLWARHFFSDDVNATTSIADVSIRVQPDPANGGMLTEFVTYCGVSTSGNQAGVTTTMAPLNPFGLPPATATFLQDTYAGGSANNGSLQWDGIVGRVSNLSGSTAPALDFHSIVGGAGDDFLLGIAQKSLNEFAVVGATRSVGNQSGFAFPLTQQDVFGGGLVEFASLATGWEFGVVCTFDASSVSSSGLQLLSSRLVGAIGATTILKDVIWRESPGSDYVAVVGSTSFAGMATEPAFASQSVGQLYGTHSGIALVAPDFFLQAAAPGPWVAGRYFGKPGSVSSGLRGHRRMERISRSFLRRRLGR